MLNRVAVVASNVLIYMQMIIQYIGWPIETEKKETNKLENRKPQIRLKQKYKSHNGIPKPHNETNIQTKTKAQNPKRKYKIQNTEEQQENDDQKSINKELTEWRNLEHKCKTIISHVANYPGISRNGPYA